MGGYAAPPLAYEPIQGNSLTQFVRSIEGAAGGMGQQAFNQSGMTNSTGVQTVQGGLATAAPALANLTALTKGDQGNVNQAIEPEANKIRSSFAAVRNIISGQARGGGKTSALAEAPYKERQEIQDTATKERENASAELAGLGMQESQLGLGEQQVALGQGSLAAQLIGESANTALTTRGQDFSNTFASQFNQISQGLSALI